MHKVNNPSNRGYKHRCFPPGGNSTSPRLMFLSLKLVIGGHEPTIMHNADHGPMVQGGLLTAHPGSVHGGGEAPEGQSSLRQGARKRPSSAPDLGSAAVEHRRDRKKGFCPRGFRDKRQI